MEAFAEEIRGAVFYHTQKAKVVLEMSSMRQQPNFSISLFYGSPSIIVSYTFLSIFI